MSKATRERILEVAAEQFATVGYGATRMMDVAKRAGIARPTLYQYFDNKESLLLGINDHVMAYSRDQEKLLTGEGAGERKTCRERIENWMEAGLTDIWRLNALRVITNEDVQEVLKLIPAETRDAMIEITDILVGTIQEGIDSGEFRGDINARDVAFVLGTILLGLQRNNVSKSPLLKVKSREQITMMLEYLMRSIVT
jgi:AcrR family transcriptional regulator